MRVLDQAAEDRILAAMKGRWTLDFDRETKEPLRVRHPDTPQLGVATFTTALGIISSGAMADKAASALRRARTQWTKETRARRNPTGEGVIDAHAKKLTDSLGGD